MNSIRNNGRHKNQDMENKNRISNRMKIYVGTDHTGFELKEKLVKFLMELGHEVVDKGAYSYNKEDDYPDFISQVAKEVSEDPDNSFGIIFGKSGQGEAIVANRFKNVRAVVYYGGNEKIIRLSREHNNANILSLGAGFIDKEKIKEIVEMWLHTEFSGEDRHIRRIKKIG